jgi:hypothetical protein
MNDMLADGAISIAGKGTGGRTERWLKVTLKAV